MLDKIGRFADGVAVEVVGKETLRLCTELIDGVVLVSQDAICASIKVRLSSYSLLGSFASQRPLILPYTE